MDFAARLTRIGERLEREGLDALLVTNMTNVRYLSGFTGTNGYVLVGRERARFFTDGRYRLQASEQVKDAEVQVCSNQQEVARTLSDLARDWGLSRVGFEGADVTLISRRAGWEPPLGMDRLKSYFGSAELVPTARWVEELRAVKDRDEVRLIQEAAEITDAAFDHILQRVKPGVSERALALEIEFYMRRSGADDVSFDPIVAAAERSALPHAQPTDRPVETGRYLLFDFGCIVGGYCSDMTRTTVVGASDQRHIEVYELVQKSQAAGLGAAAPGVGCGEVDQAARQVIDSAGHAELFPHGLGHGVGLEIHEDPVLRRGIPDTLGPGHVVTVEPGVYFEGWGGVRIEDLVVVTENGVQPLSRAPKDLIVT
ncbi:MAG: Xaa-Pro peptidase family protein [Actinomycetota bacterium]|nr:Xaa-Pro peptidase family protein [Actinomycetota bacterium]